jgi:hypothetical protein
MVKKSNGIEDPKIDVFKQLQTFSKKSVSDVATILESDESFMGALNTLIKNCSYFLNIKNIDTQEGKLLVENLDLVPELEKAISKITISFDERFVTNNNSYVHEIKNLKINIPQDTNPNIKTIITERFPKIKDKFLEINVYDIKKSPYQKANKSEIESFLLKKIKKELYPFNIIFRDKWIETTTKIIPLLIGKDGQLYTDKSYKFKKECIKFGNLQVGLNTLGTYSSESNGLFFNYLCNNIDLNKKLLLEIYAEKIIKYAIKKASEVLVMEDPFTIDDVRKGNAKLELISDKKMKEGLKFNYNVLGLKDFIKNEKDPKQIERFAEIIAELLKGNA